MRGDLSENKRKQLATPSGMRTRSSTKRQCVEKSPVVMNASKSGRVSSSSMSVTKKNTKSVTTSTELMSTGDESPRKITIRHGSRRLNSLSRCAPTRAAPVKASVKVKVEQPFPVRVERIANPVVPEFTDLNSLEVAPLFEDVTEDSEEVDEEGEEVVDEEDDEEQEEEEDVDDIPVSYDVRKLDSDFEEDEDEEDDELDEEIPKFEYQPTRKNSLASDSGVPSLSSSPSSSLLSSPMLNVRDDLALADLPASGLDISTPEVNFEISETVSTTSQRWPIENIDFSSSFSVLLRPKEQHATANSSPPTLASKPGRVAPPQQQQQQLQQEPQCAHPQAHPQAHPHPYPHHTPQFHPYGPHFIPYAPFPLPPDFRRHDMPMPTQGFPQYAHHMPHMPPLLLTPVPQLAPQQAHTQTPAQVTTKPEVNELDDFVDYNSADDECSLGSLFVDQPKVPICGYRDRNSQSVLTTAPPNRSRVIAVLSSISPDDAAADKKGLLNAYYQQAIIAAQGLNRRSLWSGSAQQMFCGN